MTFTVSNKIGLVPRCRGLLAGLVFMLGTVIAQAAAQALPVEDAGKVDAVLQQHVTAVGGDVAVGKIFSRRSSGTLERNGTKIPFVQSQRAPNLFQSETRFPRPGPLKQGFDGATAWVLHPQQGGRRLAGRELAAVVAAAWFNPISHLGEMYAVRRWLGERTVEGRSLLAIELAPRAGELAETWCFDAETHLLARIEKSLDAGPQGIVPVVMVLEDYRLVDGVKLAFRMRTRLPTMETILQFETIEQNITFPDGFFAAPFSTP